MNITQSKSVEADLYPNWIWKGKVTALGWPVPSRALAQRLRGQVWLQHVFPSLTWAALPQLPPSNQFSAHIAANEAPASPIPVWGWSELELLSGDCNPDTHSCMQIQTCVATIRILWLDPSLKCTILIYFDYLKSSIRLAERMSSFHFWQPIVQGWTGGSIQSLLLL